MRAMGHHILVPTKAIAEYLNSHFVTITDSLGIISSFKSSETDLKADDMVDMAMDKFKIHRCITTIKERVMIYRQFEFANKSLG